METQLKLERHGTRVLILIFLLMTEGIATAGYFYYRNYEYRYRQRIEGQLAAIADLKADGLSQDRREWLGDASILFQNASLTAMVRRFLATPTDADAQGQLRAWLAKFGALNQYEGVILLDARGVTRMSVPESAQPVAAQISQRLPEVLRANQVVFQDFYRHERNQHIYLAAMVPIVDDADHNRPLGVIILHIDPTLHSYPYITRWPAVSETAETLLVRRDGGDALFLNDPRFRAGAALNLRIPLTRLEVPAVRAVLGYEGIVEGPDYRGTPVIASVRRIPDSPWFLVARMARSEAYAPVRQRLWEVAGSLGVLILGAGLGLEFLSRQQRARFDNDRYQSAEALRESEGRLRQAEEVGHLGHWNHDARTDRIAWSDEMYRLHGVTPESFEPTTEGIRGLIHPDDRDGFDQANATVAREGEGPYQYRVAGTDGSLRYLAGKGLLARTPAGEPAATYGVALDTTEIMLKERELQARTDEMVRFTYSVSHDLKSPVVTVQTFAGYLEADILSKDAERINSDLGYIRGAAERMSRLLDELLRLTRVGHKMNPLTDAPLDAIVEEALQQVAGPIARRGVKVEVTREPVLLHGDYPRLVEVFQNLVDNAVKFMGEQPEPRIEIGVETSGRETVLFVRDNGIGIDPRHKDRLFGLFEKLNPATEGTGIGLTLVRRIVEVHGGRVWAESPGPGRGATFRFTLAKAIHQTGGRAEMP